MPVETNNTRDVKIDALDRFGKDIMSYYETDDLEVLAGLEDEEGPLLAGSPKLNPLSMLSGLMQKGESAKERTV
jgi:hypothetical protein